MQKKSLYIMAIGNINSVWLNSHLCPSKEGSDGNSIVELHLPVAEKLKVCKLIRFLKQFFYVKLDTKCPIEVKSDTDKRETNHNHIHPVPKLDEVFFEPLFLQLKKTSKTISINRQQKTIILMM